MPTPEICRCSPRAKAAEAIVLLLWAFVSLSLMMASEITGPCLIQALPIILFALLLSKSTMPWRKDTRSLVATCSGLLLGLWLFLFFLHQGIVGWPIGRVGSLGQYGRMLWDHILLVMLVLGGVVLCAETGKREKGHFVRWGQWPAKRDKGRGHRVLTYLFIAVVLWAVATMARYPIERNVWPLFALLALTKATLTSLVEEVAYRGFILFRAVRVYGKWGGILWQAALYAAFHIYLGAAFFGPAFVPVVFLFGLWLGWVATHTNGIGWGVTVHAVVGLIIEWENIHWVS